MQKNPCLHMSLIRNFKMTKIALSFELFWQIVAYKHYGGGVLDNSHVKIV